MEKYWNRIGNPEAYKKASFWCLLEGAVCLSVQALQCPSRDEARAWEKD